MEDNNRKRLDDEIKRRFIELERLETGDSKTSSAVDDLRTLYELQLTENKNEWEFQEKYETRANEEKFRKDQLKVQIIDNVCKLAIQSATIIVPMIFYAKWMEEGFKFEETGVYTSSTFRGLWSRFKA